MCDSRLGDALRGHEGKGPTACKKERSDPGKHMKTVEGEDNKKTRQKTDETTELKHAGKQ